MDARKWVASKIDPSKWGEKTTVQVEGQIDLLAAIAAADTRLAPQVTANTPIPLPAPHDEVRPSDSDSTGQDDEEPDEGEPSPGT